MPQKSPLAYAIPIATLLLFRVLLPINLCDDAYISFRVAQNAGMGHGMVFNAGDHTYVTTSPVWVLLLAGLRFFVGDVIIAAYMLGVVFELWLVVVLVYYGKRSSSGSYAGMFAALLLLTNPVFLLTSFSGMELPLFLLVLVLTAYFIIEQRWTAASACAAGAVWVRFDGVVILLATLMMAIWSQRAQLKQRPHNFAITFAPATVILTSYVLFGVLTFDTWIPMSVYRKALTAPGPFSWPWLTGSFVVAKEFAKALMGRSASWYLPSTALAAVVLLFALGLWLQWRRKDKTLLPILIPTACYIVVYLASGSSYARNFPWYFTPILPAACLSGGVALIWVLRVLCTKLARIERFYHRGIPQALLALLWIAFCFVPLKRNGVRLGTVYTADRERVYASAAVWAGRHLDAGALIAANEIGSIGFFLPPDVLILDMFGILRTKDNLRESGVEIVSRKRPLCIFTRQHFAHKEAIEQALPNEYRWYRFRTLEIGLRSDLRAELEPHLRELEEIYGTMRLDREYAWNRMGRHARQASSGAQHQN